MQKRVVVTGGAGFIGSALVRKIIGETDHNVLVLDKLTYAANLASLTPVAASPRLSFLRCDICDHPAVQAAFDGFDPDLVVNLAAESHVDRSIEEPDLFVQTNVVGTGVLLQAALRHWQRLPAARRQAFRFHHVSTDEVFGSLGPSGLFREDSPYAPNSPYAASKAGSDHLVRAWHRTFGLPTILTNCCNNYGPCHFPEKLIPLTILNAYEGKPLPVYGCGANVRDWLYVDDHAEALLVALGKGVPGESYNIGGNSERRNIDVVHAICDLVDELAPEGCATSRRRLLTFVKDRPGHDWRYAMDASKICRELGWRPAHTFEEGLRKTVVWYLENRGWWEAIRSGVPRAEHLVASA